MKRRTKLLSVILGFTFIVALLLSGCHQNINADVSIIENTFYSHTIYSGSGGKVTENIVLNFDVFNLSQPEIEPVIVSAFMNCLQVKTLLETEMVQKINAGSEGKFTVSDIAVATERKNNKIAFTIYFKTNPTWQFFNSLSTSMKEPIKIYRLFDYTRIDRKDMVACSTSLGGEQNFLGNYLKNRIFTLVDNEDSTLIASLNVKSVYGYATKYARRKTNAPMIAIYENLYFHIWDTSDNNAVFEFWYVLARVESWYILSLIIAFITILTVLIASGFKKNAQAVAHEVIDIQNDIKEKPQKRIKTKDE